MVFNESYVAEMDELDSYFVRTFEILKIHKVWKKL